MTQRQPEIRGQARIGPLAVLPLFVKLAGKRVVIAGGSEAALWKAELLAAAGADVAVYASEPVETLVTLAEKPPAGSISIHYRPWSIDVLEGAAFAVGAIEAEPEAMAFRCAAKAAGVPVNIVDRPHLCDVQFGGIVNRSPLVIGISTDGAAPVFGQAIRMRIEAVLPDGLRRWADAARTIRPLVQARALAFRARRSFWERFSDLALARPSAAPDPGTIRALLASTGESPALNKGRILLVGAGPGDPELLTLKAVRALQSADVIVHDDLVPDAVLDLARREATRINAGKRGHRASCRQDDINGMVIRLASEGRIVVRLKAGDPMIFGRAGEEIAAARAAGVPVEVVSGISAAQGAAAGLLASLTHRDHARRLQYVTAHAANGQLPDDLNLDALCDEAASTVIYMGRSTFKLLAERLVLHGMAGDMPAVAVFNATRGDERVVAGTVTTLASTLEDVPADGPLVILIGRAFVDALRSGRAAGLSALPAQLDPIAAPKRASAG